MYAHYTHKIANAISYSLFIYAKRFSYFPIGIALCKEMKHLSFTRP